MSQSQPQKIIQALNPAQQKAVQAINGPVLIIAGAGSGKTKTLTHRVAYLISQAVEPKAIVALTFTNKAAEEMKKRIAFLIPQTKTFPFIGTFHKFALLLLREQASLLGYRPNFSIYDEVDSQGTMQQALKNLNYQDNPRTVFKKLSFLKNRGDALIEANLPLKLVQASQEYERLLFEQNALDFDNIILKALELLQKNPETLKKYQDRYTHFLVDEYQDTNKPQYDLLRLLTGKQSNLCVVGDDWQSIYGFRSADYRILLNFEADWPKAQVFYLEQNYRSTQNILDASHGVITKNISRTDKKLFTDNPLGEPVAITQFADEQQEMLWTKQALFSRLSQGVPLSEIAILFRTNVQSRIFEDLCIQEQLPYQLVGAFRFYKRKEILDMIAYLRLINNPNDDAALERIINVPPRGIGATSLERFRRAKGDFSRLPALARDRLKRFSALLQALRQEAKKASVKRLLERLIELIGYKEFLDTNTDEGQERWENIQELMRIAEAFPGSQQTGLAEFLQTIQLMQETDELDNNAPKLTLMTLHSAKGLEFDTVFISGLEEGLLPHQRSLAFPEQLEEERRLLYVGMTRAKNRLYLTLCQTRYLHGSLQYNLPSRFIHDIPEPQAQFHYQTSTPLTKDNDGLLYEYHRDTTSEDDDIILLK
jgi:DNA helicase-2/ATP-dependent DNA helicase PcrA